MLRSDIFWLLPAILIALFQVKWLWRKLPDFETNETLFPGEYSELETFKFDYFVYGTYFILLIQLIFPLFAISSLNELTFFLRIFGYILVILGFTISLLALLSLGKNWTGMDQYRIKKNQVLLTTGIYKLIRHPIYLAVVLELTGFELIAGSWVFLLFLVFGTIIFLNHIKKEEKLLEKAFGDEFKSYKKRTKMLLPFLF